MIQCTACLASNVHAISALKGRQPHAIVDTDDLNEDRHMSRHLNNLQRLWAKLQRRYGNDDALVLEVKREIDAIEAKNRSWPSPRRDFRQVGSEKLAPQNMETSLAT
jgi:hypothetical protein